MSFLRRLFSSSTPSDDILWIYVECEKCGERLRIRVNKANDLSVAGDEGDEVSEMAGADESGSDDGFVLRKEILGNNCPRLMSVEAHFDSRKQMTEMTAQHCRLITREEFEATAHSAT